MDKKPNKKSSKELNKELNNKNNIFNNQTNIPNNTLKILNKTLSTNIPDDLIINPNSKALLFHKNIIFISLLLLILFLSIFFIRSTINSQVTASAFIFSLLPANCSANFVPGYNIISLSCISTEKSIESVLNNYSNKFIAIYQYNPNSPDPWSVYNPHLPWYVHNDLKSLSRKKGYIMLANSSGIINITNGTIPSISRIYLFTGFNLVGFPSLINKSLPDVLGNLSNSISIYSYINNSWVFWNISNNESLKNLTTGRGYWFLSKNRTYWYVTKD